MKNRSHGLESWLLSYEDKKYVHNCGKNYHGIELCFKNSMYWKFHCKSLSRKVISNWNCFNYQLLFEKVMNYHYQLLSEESNYFNYQLLFKNICQLLAAYHKFDRLNPEICPLPSRHSPQNSNLFHHSPHTSPLDLFSFLEWDFIEFALHLFPGNKILSPFQEIFIKDTRIIIMFSNVVF